MTAKSGQRPCRKSEATASADAVEAAHEALCRRCGRCCYHKLVVGDLVIALKDPCTYLDANTKLCTIYENRFELNPDCLNIERGIARRAFPEDCPYVADLTYYKGPIYGLSDEEIEHLTRGGETEG